MILLCQLGFLIIFVLDFDKYMSIINLSIDATYTFLTHRYKSHRMRDILS